MNNFEKMYDKFSRIGWGVFFAVVILASFASGAEGGATDTSEPASEIWSILAGQGTFGALLFALAGLIWKFLKPYADAWVANKKLVTLYNFAQTAYASTEQTYVSAIRAAHEDGKLTLYEKNEALRKARSTFIALCKTQGIDVVKEYGEDFILWIIEKFIGDRKEAAALKAVALPLSVPTAQTGAADPVPPLPDLQPLQPIVLRQDVPASTVGEPSSATTQRG